MKVYVLIRRLYFEDTDENPEWDNEVEGVFTSQSAAQKYIKSEVVPNLRNGFIELEPSEFLNKNTWEFTSVTINDKNYQLDFDVSEIINVSLYAEILAIFARTDILFVGEKYLYDPVIFTLEECELKEEE